MLLCWGVGWGQGSFPDRSWSISGGVISQRVINTDSTQVQLLENEFNNSPFSQKTGTALSLESAVIFKRKNDKKGYNVFSLRVDFANLHNDIITYRDTFSNAGSRFLLNDVYKGEDIFVSSDEFRPFEMRRLEIGIGRWYSKNLFRSNLNLTLGASLRAGFERIDYTQFFEFGVNEELEVEESNILSSINLEAMLNYPISNGLSVFVKVTSEFLTLELNNTNFPTRHDRRFNSTILDFDVNLDLNYLHLSLIHI